MSKHESEKQDIIQENDDEQMNEKCDPDTLQDDTPVKEPEIDYEDKCDPDTLQDDTPVKEPEIDYEDKFKRTLADFQNLQRQTKKEIENGINAKMDKFFVEFLQIHDDFVRARDVFTKNKIDIKGLESILKNMNALLERYQIRQISAIGEIFDPNLHEAISIVKDPALDDETITKEIRKGYTAQDRIIRPTLVEISKKD